MHRCRTMLVALAATVAGLASAQGPGPAPDAGAVDPWSFTSPRARAAKETYDLGARRASDRFKAELARLRKPLVAALETALKKAQHDGDQQETARLQAALGQVNEQVLLPPSTEIVGWSATFGGHSYLAILAGVKWNDARAICKKLGGSLACIETREEMVFLQKLTSGVGVYVGATDSHREGDWRWVNRLPVAKDLWKIKEPDGSRGQDHAALSTAGLYDVSDGDIGIKGFICEWDE